MKTFIKLNESKKQNTLKVGKNDENSIQKVQHSNSKSNANHESANM